MHFNTENPKGLAAIVLTNLFRVFRYFLRLLPPQQMLALGTWVGQRVASLLKRDTKIAVAQLCVAFPGGDPREDCGAPQDVEKSHHALVEDMYGHFGESGAELLMIDRYFNRRIPQEKRANATPNFRSIGETEFNDAIAQGKGVIALSGHLGCFELIAALETYKGMTLSVVGRMPNYPWLARLLCALRAEYGVKTLWREDPAAMRNIMRAMSGGEVVAALIDQDVQLDNEFANFFGIPAAYPRVLVSLAIARGIPLFSSFIYRESRMQHVVVTELIEYDAKDPNAPEIILEIYGARLEALLKQYPEQWPWWHRRWRRRPDINYRETPEELLSTNDYLLWLEQQR